MIQPALDPPWVPRMLRMLSLRPGERVLCVGPASDAMASHAAALVGPTGRVVTAPQPELEAESEFDAVVVDLTTTEGSPAGALAAIAGKTAPVGRIAVAVPPSAADQIRQLAQRAGLRGVTIHHPADPEAESGNDLVRLVTAFPPKPDLSAGDGEATAEIAVPADAVPPIRPRRRLLVAGALAAVVVAAGAGVVWALVDGDSGEDSLAEVVGPPLDGTAADADIPVAGEQAATDTPDSGDLPAGESSTNRAGAGGDADSGGDSGSGSGGGSAGSGGDQPPNAAPVIESPGIDSRGLLLAIEPIVSDPDEDDVSLLFEIDGETVDPVTNTGGESGAFRVEATGNPALALVRFNVDQVDYSHDAAVAITATDSRGAQTSQSFVHMVNAITTVTVEFTLDIDDPSRCLEAADSNEARINVELTGAIDRTDEKGLPLRARASAGYNASFEGVEPPPLLLSYMLRVEGIGTVSVGARVPREITSSTDRTINAFSNTACRGTFGYEVVFDVR